MLVVVAVEIEDRLDSDCEVVDALEAVRLLVLDTLVNELLKLLWVVLVSDSDWLVEVAVEDVVLLLVVSVECEDTDRDCVTLVAVVRVLLTLVAVLDVLALVVVRVDVLTGELLEELWPLLEELLERLVVLRLVNVWDEELLVVVVSLELTLVAVVAVVNVLRSSTVRTDNAPDRKGKAAAPVLNLMTVGAPATPAT